MSTPFVKVSNLTKQYGDLVAASDVSFELPQNGSIGIVGESGSGKTTLARCLIGLQSFDSGTISWSIDVPMAQRAQIVFQDPTSALNAAMTIGATLAEALSLAAASEEVRVVLLQGHETVFSAGNDIGDFLNGPVSTQESPVFRFLRGIANIVGGIGHRVGPPRI